MGISEAKKKIVIDNYFKAECNINTTIKDAFTRGFELGLKKAPVQQPKTGYWRPIYQGDEIINYRCTECEFGDTFGKSTYRMNYCPYCGSKNELLPQESEEV